MYALTIGRRFNGMKNTAYFENYWWICLHVFFGCGGGWGGWNTAKKSDKIMFYELDNRISPCWCAIRKLWFILFKGMFLNSLIEKTRICIFVWASNDCLLLSVFTGWITSFQLKQCFCFWQPLLLPPVLGECLLRSPWGWVRICDQCVLN